LKIIIVDDHDLFRYGLVSMFKSQMGYEVVGEAGSIQEAIAAARKYRPDLMLLDVGLPDGSGLYALQAILSEFPKMKMCILTVHEDHNILLNALRLGAKGFLLKNTTMMQLITSIKVIERGEIAIPRGMVSYVLEDYTRMGLLENSSQMTRSLTKREREVLELLGNGASNRQIADQLVIALNTAKVYVRNILDKLNLKNRNEVGEFVRRYAITRHAREEFSHNDNNYDQVSKKIR